MIMNIKFQQLFFLLLFLSINIISAQEFDESFLESLPEDLKSDLLDKTALQKDLEETQYRRPSTFIKKPDEFSERFGSQIFSMMQTTFMPLNEPSFDGSYLLDYGDVLELQMVGQKSYTTEVQIKRDGSISIEDIGKIYLSGLALSDAVELIKAKVSSVFIGVQPFVTLTNVRDIQVIIAGNVYNPGPYVLNGNSNVFHALSVSGGPSEQGSFRSINLVRDNIIIESIDLYKTFIMGKSSFNTRLRSGDLIFVNPVNNLVRVSGGVKRPGLYELRTDDDLSSLVKYANGLSAKADISDITLYRISNGKVISINLSNLEELSNIISKDSDNLIIREFPLRTVSISGAIKKPGDYIVNQGDGILDLVKRAGGYTTNAYPFGGILENNTTRKINEQAKQDLYQNFTRASSMSAAGNEAVSMNLMSVMEDMNNIPASGRVTAEFNLSILNKDPSIDINLQDGDSIIIPELIDHVYIYGEVATQGTSRFVQEKDFKYYIAMKGGYSDFADSKGVYILHPNGETIKVGKKNLFLTPNNSYKIYPGSIIYVPRKTGSALMNTMTAQAYATILGNIGVSLASISVLKD
jgi:protein involved in polysaccharide export with SLBB domain